MQLIVAVLAACCVPAMALPLPIERLEEYLATATTGQLEFRQTATDSQGHVAYSHGTLSYARPNKFRLRYAAPNELEIVSNGKLVWIYDVTLQQVIVSSFVDVPGAQGFLAVLTGGADLDAAFTKRSELGADGKLNWLILLPSNQQAYQFQECAFAFDDQGMLSHVRVLDLLDNELQAIFTPLTDIGTGATEFEFQIPDGAEVIQ